jgi:hypothetical protein
VAAVRETARDEEPELRRRDARQGRPARASNGERRCRGSREESAVCPESERDRCGELCVFARGSDRILFYRAIREI